MQGGVWQVPASRWWGGGAMGEIAEELRAASPALAHQSDSEGSSSSQDVMPGLILGATAATTAGITCRWMGCGLWFSHLDVLASHVTREHALAGPGGLFYCSWEGCTRGERGFNARLGHLVWFACDSLKVYLLYKMLVHVRTHTNEKPHHCYKCDKSFSRAENLKIHARSHTGERPYVCPVPGCGKAYSNSSDRFKHTRTHSVDKPYCCKVPGCPKRYTDPSSLRKHVKTYRHVKEGQERNMEVSSVVLEKQAESHGVSRQFDGEERLRGPNIDCSQPSGWSPMQCYWENGVQHIPPLISEDSSYGREARLFHSWIHSDLSALSRSLPWGLSLWGHPVLQSGNPTKESRVELHSESSSSCSDEGIENQDLPLDLTMHRSSTMT
ncbi:unnamed protein product [Timema podura]|uniref:C2H2-type domain-containing protein n=1 Tax=Timema podura TaxID=61482 RepID=A0ABN7NRE2_TIMPD|nr:unnamed protein product [Timema podura]